MKRKLFNSFLVIIIIINLLPIALGTISPSDKRKEKPKKELKFKKGPQDEDVFKKNLVIAEPTSKQILVNHAGYFKDTKLKRFNGTVLGYVTAWNSHGYDVAKTFARKFNIISPVWFQIIKNQDDYELTGGHDVDLGWMKEVRRNGRKGSGSVKFFPRFIFEKFNERDFSKLLTRVGDAQELSDLIIKTCKKYKFDGIVLEIWSQLAGRVDDKFLIKLILKIAQSLEKEDLKLILVIPPYREELPDIFASRHLNKLYEYVYAFSLMTYDFSNVRRPGANSPLYWNKQAVEYIAPNGCEDQEKKRSKILMGLNMYGMDFTPTGGGPIVAGQYLELLGQHKKNLKFDEHDVENYFEVRTQSGRHFVFFPTLHSVNERIKLAEELGVGLSLWELGQGLDYFFDLF